MVVTADSQTKTSVRQRRLIRVGSFLVAATLLIYLVRHQLPPVLLEFLVLAAATVALVTVAKNPLASNIIFLGAVLFLGLAVAEYHFRHFNQRMLWNNGATWEGSFITDNFFADDPDLGYGISRKRHAYESIKRAVDGRIVYDARYSVTPDGLRATPNANGPVAYFFGCSITFGVGIDDDDTLPDQFSRLSGYHTFNFGVPGYGTHHLLRALEIKRAQSFGLPRPDLVVYTAILDHINRAAGRGVGWDDYGPRYDENGNYQGPFKQRNTPPGLAERADAVSRFWWHTYDAVRAHMDIKNYMKPRTMDERKRFISLVVKARDSVKTQYDVPFVVLFWDAFPDPRTPAKGEADDVLKDLQTNGIDVIQLSKISPESGDSKFYIAGDVHPNAAGDALAAAALAHWMARRSSGQKTAVHGE